MTKSLTMREGGRAPALNYGEDCIMLPTLNYHRLEKIQAPFKETGVLSADNVLFQLLPPEERSSCGSTKSFFARFGALVLVFSQHSYW